jgi:hypothetical protein
VHPDECDRSIPIQFLSFLFFSAASAISAVKNELEMRIRRAGDSVVNSRELRAGTGLRWGEKTIIVKH